MHIQKLADSPQNHRGGQVSHLLLAPGQFGARNMLVTWVEGGPGSQQATHAHADSEQMYVIVRGVGTMHVNDETEEVGPGTLVLVPPGATHSIRNDGDEPLVFVSATAPPFRVPTENSPWRPADAQG